ncbi:MAG: haloacid dehalogenase type II, partial [Rhodovibrionaceae bacterium]
WRQKQLEYTWLRSLMRAHVDFWQVTSDGLDFALKTQGFDDKALHEKLMQLYLTLDAYPDVRPTLGALREAGFKTAILSNGSPGMLEAAVDSAEIADLLDASLSVEEVGIYKPDSQVYQLSVERLEAAPREICFVSTNSWDARGAALFGYQVAWMNRFGVEPDRLPGDFAREIGGLDELPGLLERSSR